MSVTRRSFIKTGSTWGAGMLFGIPSTQVEALEVSPGLSQDILENIRSLAAVAIDAARSSGATYTDVQFRLMRYESWGFGAQEYPQPYLYSTMGFGVRSLVNGYWGLAAQNGLINTGNAARLGKESAGQGGIISARGRPGSIELAPSPVISDGKWSMPVEIDPFTVSWEEKADFCRAMQDFYKRQRFGVRAGNGVTFVKDERASATSAGSFVRQTTYVTNGSMGLGVPSAGLGNGYAEGSTSVDFLTGTAAGWEYVRGAPFSDEARKYVDDVLRLRLTPEKVVVDVGRYDVVFDAKAMAGLADATIGVATELDRAFGYLANEQGTSYLSEPLEMLGTYKIGAPLLNVSANRSMPKGCATVKWDDEAVEPPDVNLVKDGILNDFQTTRESATWISDYYQKKGVPLHSNGCAGLYYGNYQASQVPPNFVMQPGVQDITFQDMVKDTKRGLAVIGGNTYTDHQALNGTGDGTHLFEIVNGKLGHRIAAGQYVYRTPDFWKNLVAVGGAGTAKSFGMSRGRFDNTAFYTVSAVPAKVVGVATTDPNRKA